MIPIETHIFQLKPPTRNGWEWVGSILGKLFRDTGQITPSGSLESQNLGNLEFPPNALNIQV